MEIKHPADSFDFVINNLNFNEQQFFNHTFSEKQQEIILEARDIAILRPAEVLAENSPVTKCSFDAADLSGKNYVENIYFRVDFANFPHSYLQFYDTDGTLFFTYPWNGEFENDKALPVSKSFAYSLSGFNPTVDIIKSLKLSISDYKLIIEKEVETISNFKPKDVNGSCEKEHSTRVERETFSWIDYQKGNTANV